MKTLQQFLNDLGARESAGNYKAFNRYGYAGKYQMGEAALIDAGYYRKPSRKYNNDWTGEFLGKDGVYSIQDFLNNPKAQENAQIIFKKKQWMDIAVLLVSQRRRAAIIDNNEVKLLTLFGFAID